MIGFRQWLGHCGTNNNGDNIIVSVVRRCFHNASGVTNWTSVRKVVFDRNRLSVRRSPAIDAVVVVVASAVLIGLLLSLLLVLLMLLQQI
jgi:hypothetical protein